jgi:hypothetical protein
MASTEINGVRVKLPHVCRKCGAELAADGSNFYARLIEGVRYYRHLCRPCGNRYDLDHRRGTASLKAKRTRKRKKLRDQGRLVIYDCRASDKLAGQVCDLDQAFVKDLIVRDCTYCGATREQIRIGLDRIDNTLGHLKTNVVPCCSRCNVVRKNMPHEAWLVVAPGMRAAFQQGLFGNWVPGNLKK